MRKSAVVLLSLLLCSAALAACGSDSEGSATTTATVPSGKLGAAGGEHCELPSIPGVTVTQFDVTFLDCGGAVANAAQVISGGRVTGYSCSTTPTGNGGRATCIKDGNTRSTFTVAWQK